MSVFLRKLPISDVDPAVTVEGSGMADIISLSSGSDEDSDIEVVGVYSDPERKTETIPFIRGEWISLAAYSPFVIDLTAHRWALPPPRRRRRRDSQSVEVVDLSDENCLANESERTSLSPLSQVAKRLKRFPNKTSLGETTQKRNSNTPDSSPKEQPPTNISVVQEGQDSDILQPQQKSLVLSDSINIPGDRQISLTSSECAVIVSDSDIPNNHVKSPSLPKSIHTDQEETSLWTDPISKESQYHPPSLLDEERVPPECPDNNTETSVILNDGSQPPQILSVEDEYFKPDTQRAVSVDRPLQTGGLETRADPDSPHRPADSSLSLLPQNQPEGPTRCLEELDPLDSYDFAMYDSHETELYSPTLSPYAWSPSSCPYLTAEDVTLCLGQDEESSFNISLEDHRGAQPSETQQLEAGPSPSLKPCSLFSPSPGPDHPPTLCPPLPPPLPQCPPLQTPQSHSIKTQPEEQPLSSNSMVLPVREPPGGQLVEVDMAVWSAAYDCSIPSDPPMSVTRMEEMDPNVELWGAPSDELGVPTPCPEQKESDTEVERSTEVAGGEVSKEDRRYVCPVQLRKHRPLMAGPLQSLEDLEEEDDGFGAPEQLCRQSLSLVYSTKDESYPEGTLQLLSDLLHPRFYPPRDITSHLLRDILLDTRAPRHLHLQAFSLLMRTQRHHPAEKVTIPWDWDLLTSVMDEQFPVSPSTCPPQDSARSHSSEAVCMLLQYVLQTLEDDFRVSLSLRDLRQSIAKATLSCESRRVGDVINWLLAAVVKSTGDGDTKRKEDHLKIVYLLQKMLALALEVDCCPAVSSNKLAQKLFHSCTSTLALRQHRLLLLETLESKLLRCRLLELLLEQGCAQRTSLPMSLGLLLHFLKHCTLTPDPMDGAERGLCWEELIQLLWMLLLSHEAVLRGHLRCSVTDRAGNSRGLVPMVNDAVSRSDVVEAVEDFLLRSQANLGRSLPPHVHESLTYLQDHMLEFCQP